MKLRFDGEEKRIKIKTKDIKDTKSVGDKFDIELKDKGIPYIYVEDDMVVIKMVEE